ncbi:nad-dependent protein deacetylase of sir2 family [hydrocarbon metagenome]|uniref:Nad-dependent protein deacetylase of sir2 family n=1 Tax=hydrocarbon metagenome TaxID=938273 RepID=A0A0W8E430_9ZZZZ
MEKQALDQVVSVLTNSRNTIVVTGAGISTEAGIPDFRGPDGIYRKLGEDKVMNIININAFNRDPEEFYDFYRRHFVFPPAAPGKAHQVLADMEKKGRVKGIVTQNIDSLHEKAGSRKVIAIHGTADRYICRNRGCQGVYGDEYVKSCEDAVPRCKKCGSVLKPDVVLFGENIKDYAEARDMILGAQVLVVIGSSLTVYPLAGFVKEFSTFYQDLIIINKGRTQLDHAALIKIDGGHTGDTLEEINRQMDLRGK